MHAILSFSAQGSLACAQSAFAEMASVTPDEGEIFRLKDTQLREYLSARGLSTKGSGRWIRAVRLFNHLYGKQHDVLPPSEQSPKPVESQGSSVRPSASSSDTKAGVAARLEGVEPVLQDVSEAVEDAMRAMNNARKDEIVLSVLKSSDPQLYSKLLVQGVQGMTAEEMSRV